MPFKVQAIPPGLQSLLGIFDSTSPSLLADQIVGTVDLTPRFNARLLTTASQGPTGGLVALGATITLTVPAGEAWDLVSANFTCSCAAAAVVPALELNINGAAVAFQMGTDSVRANPYEQTVCYVPPAGLVLSPGHTIQGAVRSTPNSALTGLVRALVRVTRV